MPRIVPSKLTTDALESSKQAKILEVTDTVSINGYGWGATSVPTSTCVALEAGIDGYGCILFPYSGYWYVLVVWSPGGTDYPALVKDQSLQVTTELL